jgi:hypothetical protein
MKLADGMTADTWAEISRLPPDIRDRVLERSCLLYYGGAVDTWQEADAGALAIERRKAGRR